MTRSPRAIVDVEVKRSYLPTFSYKISSSELRPRLGYVEPEYESRELDGQHTAQENLVALHVPCGVSDEIVQLYSKISGSGFRYAPSNGTKANELLL